MLSVLIIDIIWSSIKDPSLVSILWRFRQFFNLRPSFRLISLQRSGGYQFR